MGFGDTSAEALKRVFVALCAVESPDDGLTFLPESVQVEAIREDQEYGGMRIKVMAMLGNVRIPLQVDVGAGDAVVPPPEVLDYPGLLDLPRAQRLYARGIREENLRVRIAAFRCSSREIVDGARPS